MIANPKRLPLDAVGFFAVIFAMDKYHFVLAGENIPFSTREFATMAAISIIGAFLLEHRFWKSDQRRNGQGK